MSVPDKHLVKTLHRAFWSSSECFHIILPHSIFLARPCCDWLVDEGLPGFSKLNLLSLSYGRTVKKFHLILHNPSINHTQHDRGKLTTRKLQSRTRTPPVQMLFEFPLRLPFSCHPFTFVCRQCYHIHYVVFILSLSARPGDARISHVQRCRLVVCHSRD